MRWTCLEAGQSCITHLSTDHCQGFALGGVDFARHDAAARLVLGQLQLSQATPGAATQQADVVCDFHERDRNRIQSA